MTLYYSRGDAQTELSANELDEAIASCLARLGPRQKVLVIPPDFTRFHSQAGPITCRLYAQLGDRLTDILPALGTHDPIADWQRERMYPGIPAERFRRHDWRNDVTTIGYVPAEFVERVSEGIWNKPWPAQLNRLVWQGEHDLIVSVGQVVPHEVIGMANYNKNLFVGTGGCDGINESHFIGAVYGMERMMGRTHTPLRRILNEAERLFCSHLPRLYILTVIGQNERREPVIRGLYIGDDSVCFEQAAELSRHVNFTILDQSPPRIVAYLDPEEFHSTWLGNKAVYRTRMLIADQGELVVLAPGVKTFGEDRQIDRLIRKYGYRTTPEILRQVRENRDLQENLSAAAHLIHGSSEGRFRITYCPGHVTREEIEGVGYGYAPLEEMLAKYDPRRMQDGWNDVAGESIYFVRNPALGLWAARGRLEA